MAGKESSTPSRRSDGRSKHLYEREQYRYLLIGNPNYFGNVPDSVYEPVVPITNSTTYEEIVCVGLQPQLDRLEGVVHVKLGSGYGGDLCGGGTPEYVRFYLSFDGGSTWQDQGVTSFTAYDLPGDKPLEYGVSLAISPSKKFCFIEHIVRVRAILSWNSQPPPNTPSFTPVWGNVLEASVQIDPLSFFPFKDLLAQAEIEIPKQLLPVLEGAPLAAAAPPKALSGVELHELYQKKDVPPLRYLFREVIERAAPREFVEPAGLLPPALPFPVPPSPIPPFPEPPPEPIPPPPPPDMVDIIPGLDLSDLIDKLQQTDGDTTYEELRCVGLNPNGDVLNAVLTVKLSSGYSGDLCSAGSREYVAFWIDWGSGWTYAGTTSVGVHDIGAIPPGGLSYAVMLPLDVSTKVKACTEGAVTARVRAILSWQTAPPSGNPDWVPTWGNREETIVHVRPGDPFTGDYRPYLESVGGVAVCSIDQATGLASGERPFGGWLTVTGFIINPPDLASPNPLKYKVWVRPLPGGAWQPLANSFGISVIEQTGGLPVGYTDTQSVDGGGFYTYKEDPNPAGGGWRLVTNRVLAQWLTADPMTGMWEIKVEAKDPATNTMYSAGTILCVADGTTRTNVKVRLDEVRPTAAVSITGVSSGGGPVEPAEDCITLSPGVTIHGQYSSWDQHFGHLTLTVEPSGPASGATVNPSSRSYPSVPTVGESGTWTLDTTGMDPCGYIVRLWVRDRTIVSGSGAGWQNTASVGFCLE